MLEATRAPGRKLYVQTYAAFQEAWLCQRKGLFTAQRWRSLQWLTPFGPVDLPVRVVRENATGRYLTLSKVLFRQKATRLLSPPLEQQACAAAPEQNYRLAGPLSLALDRCPTGLPHLRDLSGPLSNTIPQMQAGCLNCRKPCRNRNIL